MIEEIHFILHVANGIHIIIHKVIWYNYTYSNTNTNISILILVRILFITYNFYKNILKKYKKHILFIIV